MNNDECKREYRISDCEECIKSTPDTMCDSIDKCYQKKKIYQKRFDAEKSKLGGEFRLFDSDDMVYTPLSTFRIAHLKAQTGLSCSDCNRCSPVKDSGKGFDIEGNYDCDISHSRILDDWIETEHHLWCKGEHYRLKNDKPILFKHNKYSFEMKDNGDGEIPDVVVKEKTTLGEFMTENKIDFGELENLTSDTGETIANAVLKEMGNGFNKVLLDSFANPTNTVFTTEMLAKVIKGAIDYTKPYYEDKDKEYLCIVWEEMRNDILEGLEAFENVTVRKVNHQYLPNKNAIYFMQKPDNNVNFTPYPYEPTWNVKKGGI